MDNKHRIECIASVLQQLTKGTKFENKIYFVGGCVRDYIMGREAKDYDVCVTLENGGIELAKHLITHTKYAKNLVVFPTYFTANISIQLPNGNWEQLDIVETRKERYGDVNSRNPQCAYGTIEEDCYRRDLTINSMYYDISNNTILDITGKGKADINDKILRTPCDPNETFIEDPLRILRVIRFAARFSMIIDTQTFVAMCQHVDRLEIISKERINSEFNGILTASKPSEGLEALRRIGALKYIIPALTETYGLTQNEYHFGTVWEHTMSVLDNTPPETEIRMSALLHDLGKIYTKESSPMGKVSFLQHETAANNLITESLKKLKYPNDFIKNVVLLVSNHMRLKQSGDTCKITDKGLRRIIVDMGTNEMFEKLLELIHADNISHAHNYCLPNQIGLVRERVANLKVPKIQQGGVKLPISGNEIMIHLDLSPSKEVQYYKHILIEAFLENPHLTPTECFAILDKHRLNAKE